MTTDEQIAWATEVRGQIRVGLAALGLVPTDERVAIAVSSLVMIFREYPDRHFPDSDVSALVAAICLTSYELERRLARICGGGEP